MKAILESFRSRPSPRLEQPPENLSAMLSDMGLDEPFVNRRGSTLSGTFSLGGRDTAQRDLPNTTLLHRRSLHPELCTSEERLSNYSDCDNSGADHSFITHRRDAKCEWVFVQFEI